MRRKGLALLTACIVVGALSLAGCGPKSDTPGARAVLKVASQRGGTKALLVASGAIDGAPYKVEWSEFPSAQTLLEALGAGAVDTGAVGDAPFMFAYASGAKIKVVQATRSSGGGASTAILVRAASPIHSAADLRGKRVATGRGSIGHYLLLRVLEREGLKPSDVTVVFLSPGDGKAAFSSGAVDAWVTWGSYVALARLHDDARVLADGQGLLSGLGFQAATDTAIRDKRPQLEDFLRRLAKAQRWASEHKAEYAAVLSHETGLPLEVAQYTVSQARSVPTPTDAGVVAEERNTLAEFQKAGAIEKAPDISGAFDPSFNTTLKP